MSETLANSFLKLCLDPATESWNVYSQNPADPEITSQQVVVVYHSGRSAFQSVANKTTTSSRRTGQKLNSFSAVEGIESQTDPDPNGLVFNLSFALPAGQPALLWKLSIKNDSLLPVYIDQIHMLHVNSKDVSATVELPEFWKTSEQLRFFSHGWQTNSNSRAYRPSDQPRLSRLKSLTDPLWYNPETPHPQTAGVFGSDMFGAIANLQSRRGFVAGFLSQREHFGSLLAKFSSSRPSLEMWANGDGARLDPGAILHTDWAGLFFFDLNAPDPLGAYLEAVARENGTGASSDLLAGGIPVGWCSWYHFFKNITAEDIRHNLDAADSLRDQLPLQLIQIDDGFETLVGDWLSFTPGFKGQLTTLAQEIQSKGFVPGIWLAPFLVHPKSRLYRLHPDWLIKDGSGKPVKAGFLFNTFTAALDLTVPAALDFAVRTVQMAVREWGFRYLKLDFLHAAALPGDRQDATRTRAQVLRSGLEALRAAVGDEVYILGCGCPLGPAIGLVNAMRISPDVDPNWDPKVFHTHFYFRQEPGLPSTRNAIHNTLVRSALHQRWWVNDPDCLMVRPQTRLTLPEVQSLATAIAISGGSLILSDHLPALPPERLKIAQTLLPVIGLRPRLLDWLESPRPSRLRLDLENASGVWHVLAYFNWESTSQELLLNLTDYGLEPGDYTLREFWSGSMTLLSGAQVRLPDLPAHGVALYAVRKFYPAQAHYIGSDVHISQGLEVSRWRADPAALNFRLERPGISEGNIYLYLPRQPALVTADGLPLPYQQAQDFYYQFPITFTRQLNFSIAYS